MAAKKEIFSDRDIGAAGGAPERSPQGGADGIRIVPIIANGSKKQKTERKKSPNKKNQKKKTRAEPSIRE